MKNQQGPGQAETRRVQLGTGTESQEAERDDWEQNEAPGLGPGRATTSQPRPSPHLPAVLPQQLPVWLQRLLLVKGDQGVQRGVGSPFPRDHEAPIIQELHHEMAAAALGSVETVPGLGYPTPLILVAGPTP